MPTTSSASLRGLPSRTWRWTAISPAAWSFSNALKRLCMRSRGFRNSPRETEIKMDADNFLCLPPGATLQNLEMDSDLSSSMELFKRLKEALHEIARVPELATGNGNKDGCRQLPLPPSGGYPPEPG